MAQHDTDFSFSLEELTGLIEGHPDDAPTEMVADIQTAWKKPLEKLSNYEIGDLVTQHYGYPFLLDFLWPKLEADPLYDAGNYPGDILSMLIRAEPNVWEHRPDYKVGLEPLYRRALTRPSDETEAFRISLKLSGSKH